MTDEKFTEISAKYQDEKGFLIPLLQEVQSIESYISKDNIEKISKKFNIKKSQIYGVITFYSMFRQQPVGKHIIRVCQGTACHVSNAENIFSELKNILQLTDKQETTTDGLFTLIEVACLGCCSLAPAMMVDDKTYGTLTEEKLSQIISDFQEAR